MLRWNLATAAGVVGLAAILGASRTAQAQATDNKVISGSTVLSGTLFYNELTVSKGAVVTVKPYNGTTDSGVLRLKANRITIDALATITATGAGYVGVKLGTGNAEPTFNGGGMAGAAAGVPGGGGGYFGKGANGADAACMPLGGSVGGVGFYAGAMGSLMEPVKGSAGGAANVASGTAGSNGGGVIILEAAEIVINGKVEARGAPSLALSGVGSGGGSGGAIQILTGQLSGSGTLSVAGGSGSYGKGDMNKGYLVNNGGGGGGGVIIVKGPKPAATLTFNVDGGLTGSADGGLTATCPMAGGEVGMVFMDATNTCPDVDADGFTSQRCGGLDCDDSDPMILPKPKGIEICDGKDNDCDGTVDNGADICPAGEVCAGKGGCLAETDAGTDAGTNAGSPPDHVDLQGGCGIAPSPSAPAAGLLALALGALVVRRRRAAG